MLYRVFSQDPKDQPDFEKLVAQTDRFFRAKLESLEHPGPGIAVRISSTRPILEGSFAIDARDVTRDDLLEARDAEVRGRAAGMALLAEKCRRIWEITPLGDSAPSEAAYLTLAAVCASVALGPVLPPDGSTLFGVRGAIERRDAL